MNKKKHQKETNLNYTRIILFLLLIIEVIILIINIAKLIKSRKNKPISAEFREIDYHYIKMFSSAFKEISNNLTQKFYPKLSLNNTLNISLIKNSTKTKIKFIL